MKPDRVIATILIKNVRLLFDHRAQPLPDNCEGICLVFNSKENAEKFFKDAGIFPDLYDFVSLTDSNFKE